MCIWQATRDIKLWIVTFVAGTSHSVRLFNNLTSWDKDSGRNCNPHAFGSSQSFPLLLF